MLREWDYIVDLLGYMINNPVDTAWAVGPWVLSALILVVAYIYEAKTRYLRDIVSPKNDTADVVKFQKVDRSFRSFLK